MKFLNNLILIIFTLGLFASCSPGTKSAKSKNSTDPIIIKNDGNFNIYVTTGKYFNHPSFVVWIEDLEGNYLNTLYITKSYASGVYEHEMVGDTLWLNDRGPSNQPAALPFWTHKKGLIDGKVLVPSSSHPFVDAYTGATPKGNFEIITNVNNQLSKYRILFEINQLGDWNSYWSNAKYPSDKAYSHSAQPSIIYSTLINNQDSIYYLNPIGHGDPTGKSGKLFTNLATLTTSKEIIETIKVSKKLP